MHLRRVQIGGRVRIVPTLSNNAWFWLNELHRVGYERGLDTALKAALRELELLGLAERNPTCPTHWRITAEGEELYGHRTSRV